MLRRSRLLRFFHLLLFHVFAFKSYACSSLRPHFLPFPPFSVVPFSCSFLPSPSPSSLRRPSLSSPPFLFLSGIFGSLTFVLFLFPPLPFVCDLPCKSQCPMTLGGLLSSPEPFWLKVHFGLLRMRRPFTQVQPMLRLLPISFTSCH